MRRGAKLLLSALLCATLAAPGCAGLSARVDRALLDQVPNEEKLLLFDAENGVLIAADEAEVAERSLAEARRALDSARRYREVIAARKRSGASIDTPQVLELLEQWNEARIEVRQREVRLAEARRSTASVRLWAARARYERAKAKLVKDHNPERGNDVDLARFERQVEEWEGREQEADALVASLLAEVVAARETYNALSTSLQQASNGAYGGPWADLIDLGG